MHEDDTAVVLSQLWDKGTPNNGGDGMMEDILGSVSIYFSEEW